VRKSYLTFREDTSSRSYQAPIDSASSVIEYGTTAYSTPSVPTLNPSSTQPEYRSCSAKSSASVPSIRTARLGSLVGRTLA
jgi:hypothetical protein